MLTPSDLGVIADDLTGACDAAAALAPAVGPLEVIINPSHLCAFERSSSLRVINTQSRLLKAPRSRRRLMRVSRLLRGYAVIFKKTDSVLRGSAGAELEGMARTCTSHMIFVIPAIPQMGKTTRGGHLFEQGVPAHETDYGRDPLSPLATNDIRRILSATGRVEVEVEDAETDADIDRAVAKALKNEMVILAGSVGLADALARRLGEGRCASPQPGLSPSGQPPARTMIVSGSRYPRSQEQIQLAANARGEGILEVGMGTRTAGVISRCRGKRTVFLCVDAGRLSACSLAPLALPLLFRKVLRIVRAFDPQALGLIGGETAHRLLRLLHARRLEVFGMEQQGMPYGIIRDGDFAGRVFSTKGGSVGTYDACIRMVDCMTRARRAAS